MTGFVDPYIDPAIGDLHNLLGAKSSAELRSLEPAAVFANETELVDLFIPRTNDLVELCALHAQLFKGVYAWAGHIRTVDIRKTHKDAQFFVPFGLITVAAANVFGELATENAMKGLDRAKFVERLAYFYDQLNYIHPFREGNGRTQRVFWTRVAHDAGRAIDWDGVIGDENDRASRVAMEKDDRQPLLAMFGHIVR